MGESESKFRPGPQDVWYRMRKIGNQPRLLQSVMQAICDLREIGGSTNCKIVEYLDGVINCRNIKPRPRGLALQVKKALNYGLEHGLIKQRGGKFTLALNAKDFAIFKSFRSYDPIFSDTRMKKRKRVNNRKSKKMKSMKKCELVLPNSFIENGIDPHLQANADV